MKLASYTAMLLAALLAMAVPAEAAPVAWKFQGLLTANSGLGALPGAAIGDAFSFVLHFDTSTPVTNPACNTLAGGSGSLCRHNGAPITAQYLTDLRFGTFTQSDLASDAAAGNSIIVRNDVTFTYTNPPLGDKTVDGYTFGFTFSDDDPMLGLGLLNVGFLIILRGFEDLTIVTDGRVLPADPLAGLLGLQEHMFQACRSTASNPGSCDVTDLEGVFTSITRVPEPGSLALAVLALAALVVTRCRRAKAAH